MDFALAKTIPDNISQVVVKKLEALELLLTALLADGHVLLEDVLGLGKTLIAKSLAKSFVGNFKRIQFTPDLVTGRWEESRADPVCLELICC